MGRIVCVKWNRPRRPKCTPRECTQLAQSVLKRIDSSMCWRAEVWAHTHRACALLQRCRQLARQSLVAVCCSKQRPSYVWDVGHGCEQRLAAALRVGPAAWLRLGPRRQCPGNARSDIKMSPWHLAVVRLVVKDAGLTRRARLVPRVPCLCKRDGCLCNLWVQCILDAAEFWSCLLRGTARTHSPRRLLYGTYGA